VETHTDDPEALSAPGDRGIAGAGNRQAAEADGWWVKPGPGYSPKYTGTVWQVIFLGQFGADGAERRVRRSADYILDHSRSLYGGFTATNGFGGMIHCLQGNLGASLLALGFGGDPRLQERARFVCPEHHRRGIARRKI
jgi:hypothetical protein